MPKAPLDEQMPTTSEVNGLNQPTMLIRALRVGQYPSQSFKNLINTTQPQIFTVDDRLELTQERGVRTVNCALTEEHASQSIIMY